MKVTVAKRIVNGAKRWVVDWHPPGPRRKRTVFDSETAANTCAKKLRSDAHQNGKTWGGMSDSERIELLSVWLEAQAAGVSLREVWDRYRAKPTTVSSGLTLSKAIEELVTAKTAANRSADYVSNLELVLGQFAAGREQSAIDSVSLADIEGFLTSKSLASRPTLRARLSTLFKFAVRRGWCQGNPCARLEAITVPRRPPTIFTIAQVKSCLKWLKAKAPGALPWFVLSTCCGLRPEEADKTGKSDIHFKEGWIKIEAQTTKVRQRRVVYPKPEAMRLLKSSLSNGRLQMPEVSRRRVIRSLREHLGFKVWPKDITRHSAASYWLADVRKAGEIAESLGHSEKILKSNYQALVTRENARLFWKLVGGFKC